MLDVSNMILIKKAVWYSDSNDNIIPNTSIEVNVFRDPDTKKYIGHLKTSVNGYSYTDIQIIDYGYLTLCYQIHKKCFHVLNKYYFMGIKSKIEANRARNILEWINGLLISEYNKQLQMYRACKSFPFPIDFNKQQLVFNCDEIAKALIHSGYTYTLYIKSYPNPNDSSITDTYAIYSSDVGNGNLYYICHFDNVTFDVTIKEKLFCSNIDGLSGVSSDNWLYDGIINDNYHNDIIYEYICKKIMGPTDPYYIRPGYDNGMITFEGIKYILSISGRYIQFADIINPSRERTEYIDIFDGIRLYHIPTKHRLPPNRKVFTNALSKKLEEVRTYDQYPLIMVSKILQKIEMHKSKFS